MMEAPPPPASTYEQQHAARREREIPPDPTAPPRPTVASAFERLHAPRRERAIQPVSDYTITLSEPFHLCAAVPHKWEPEVRHNEQLCKEAYCKHAALFAMLMDPTVLTPAEDSR